MLFPSPSPAFCHSSCISPSFTRCISVTQRPPLSSPNPSSSPLYSAQDSHYFCILAHTLYLCFCSSLTFHLSHINSPLPSFPPFIFISSASLSLLTLSLSVLFYFYFSFFFALLSLLTVTIGFLLSFHVSPLFSCAALSHSSA